MKYILSCLSNMRNISPSQEKNKAEMINRENKVLFACSRIYAQISMGISNGFVKTLLGSCVVKKKRSNAVTKVSSKKIHQFFKGMLLFFYPHFFGKESSQGIPVLCSVGQWRFDRERYLKVNRIFCCHYHFMSPLCQVGVSFHCPVFFGHFKYYIKAVFCGRRNVDGFCSIAGSDR